MTIFCILILHTKITPDFDPVSITWNNPFMTKLIAHVGQMGQMTYDPGSDNFSPFKQSWLGYFGAYYLGGF